MLRQRRIRRAIIDNHDIIFKPPHGPVPSRQVYALVYELDERPPTHRKGFRLIRPCPQRRRPGPKPGCQLRRRRAGDASQVGRTDLTKQVGVEKSFDGRKPKLTSHIHILGLLSRFAGHAGMF